MPTAWRLVRSSLGRALAAPRPAAGSNPGAPGEPCDSCSVGSAAASRHRRSTGPARPAPHCPGSPIAVRCGLGLPVHVVGQPGAVAPTDIQAQVRAERPAPVVDRDPAVVALGVDDEDARRSDDDVVDVRPGPGHAPVVEDDHSRHIAERCFECLRATSPIGPCPRWLRLAGVAQAPRPRTSRGGRLIGRVTGIHWAERRGPNGRC
jgi:hypothetical protein